MPAHTRAATAPVVMVGTDVEMPGGDDVIGRPLRLAKDLLERDALHRLFAVPQSKRRHRVGREPKPGQASPTFDTPRFGEAFRRPARVTPVAGFAIRHRDDRCLAATCDLQRDLATAGKHRIVQVR